MRAWRASFFKFSLFPRKVMHVKHAPLAPGVNGPVDIRMFISKTHALEVSGLKGPLVASPHTTYLAYSGSILSPGP